MTPPGILTAAKILTMKERDARFEFAADPPVTPGPTPRREADTIAGAAPVLPDEQSIRQLFADYVRMYCARDDRLTTHFSENFSGFTGGGDFLVKDRAAWIAITRQDFAQVKDPIRIEIKDLAVQALTDTIAVATGFFTIHLPIADQILSRETARLVLIFRRESAGWKIAHSSISIPYHLVREGEIYPLNELGDRNQFLEKLVAERTIQLSAANDSLRESNAELAREIAEHKLAKDALQQSEQRYRSILNASPDDITITDMACRIVMISPAALPMFGYDGTDDVQGRALTDFIVAEDRARAAARLAEKCQGIVTGPNEYRGLRRDGSTFAIEANSEFIRDAQGVPIGMVFIVRDISERKDAEAERDRLAAQNRQLQKAESLSRMAGAIAHHFNNQLQAVMLGLELTMKEMSDNAGAFAKLSVAMQSARKAAEVSSLMLTYLGQTVAKREPLDVAQVCRQSLPLLRVIMPHQIVLETELPGAGPVIHADTNELQHVLTNLITNAWEAGDDSQGAVRVTVKTVSAAEIPAKHRFPIDCQLQDTSYACLEVVDRGCGIPEHDVEKIFDPFFSSKFIGRGMGLAVVLGIARAYDGVVTVESELDAGSVFRVFLPMSAPT